MDGKHCLTAIARRRITIIYTLTEGDHINHVLLSIFRYHRRRYLRMRAASIVLQKHIRGYLGRKHYRAMRTGYMRLQALIRSRILSHKFKHLRGHIIRLQVPYYS